MRCAFVDMRQEGKKDIARFCPNTGDFMYSGTSFCEEHMKRQRWFSGCEWEDERRTSPSVEDLDHNEPGYPTK